MSTPAANATRLATVATATPLPPVAADLPIPSLRRYGTRTAPPFTYRQQPKAAPPDLRQQVQKIEQQIHKKVVHEIAQTTPWRSQLNDALLSPQVVRSLADQVSRALGQRASLERYRRGY